MLYSHLILNLPINELKIKCFINKYDYSLTGKMSFFFFFLISAPLNFSSWVI